MSPEIDSATGFPIGIGIGELERALKEKPIAVLINGAWLFRNAL